MLNAFLFYWVPFPRVPSRVNGTTFSWMSNGITASRRSPTPCTSIWCKTATMRMVRSLSLLVWDQKVNVFHVFPDSSDLTENSVCLIQWNSNFPVSLSYVQLNPFSHNCTALKLHLLYMYRQPAAFPSVVCELFVYLLLSVNGRWCECCYWRDIFFQFLAVNWSLLIQWWRVGSSSSQTTWTHITLLPLGNHTLITSLYTACKKWAEGVEGGIEKCNDRWQILGSLAVQCSAQLLYRPQSLQSCLFSVFLALLLWFPPTV